MEITHIEHIGIAVKNINEAIKFYEEVLGLKCYATEEIRSQKTKTAFFMVGQTKIELLESLEPMSPVDRFIQAKGEGVHHIAFSVNNIQDSLKEVELKGVQLIDKEPKSGAENLNIAFLHPKSSKGVLIEFCEKKE